MAYLLMILGFAGVMFVSAPARDFVVANMMTASHRISETVATQRGPAFAKLKKASDFVGSKAMELLREQLHRSVDGLTK